MCIVGGLAKKFKIDGADISIDSFNEDYVYCYPDFELIKRNLRYGWVLIVGREKQVVNSVDIKINHMGFLSINQQEHIANSIRAAAIDVVRNYYKMTHPNTATTEKKPFIDNGELDEWIKQGERSAELLIE